MNCENYDVEIFTRLSAGTPLPREVMDHLASCATCRQAMSDDKEVFAALDREDWPPTPPLDMAALEDRLDRKAEDYRAQEAASAKASSNGHLRPLGLLGLAVVAFLGLGWTMLRGFESVTGPALPLVASFYVAGALLWSSLGAGQQRLATDRVSAAIGLRFTQAAVGLALVLAAVHPGTRDLLEFRVGDLVPHNVAADANYFDVATLCARTRDGLLRLAGGEVPCRDNEVALPASLTSLANPATMKAPFEYRSGTAVIPADLSTVFVTFSAQMPNQDYQASVVIKNPPAVITASDTCQFLTVSQKSTTGFVVNIRRCSQSSSEPAASDLTIDWIAIASR